MKCPACHSKKFEFWKKCSSQHIQNDEYQLYQCKDCLHVQAIGDNDNFILSKIYSEPFFSTSAQNDSLNSPASKNAINRAKRLNTLYSPKSTLDIGAGIGLFVSAMGKYCPVIGVEYSKHAVEKAGKLANNVIQLDFTKSLTEIETVLDNRSFDLITLWDVSSCFEDQSDIFVKIFSLCSNESNVVVTVPIYDSAAARVMGKFWPFWIPPVNQHYYTSESIVSIASIAGFKNIQISKRWKYVGLDFLLQKFLRTIGFAANWKIIGLFSAIKLPINTFDIAEVHMEKSLVRK